MIVLDGAGHCKINVVGKLDSGHERKQLLADLQGLPENVRQVELVFFDALTLPEPVVAALARLKLAGVELKIHVYTTYLAHYLAKLGLPARYVMITDAIRPLAKVRALALGGSADSLDKILQIVERLPAAEVSVFIVQHVLEDSENLLDRLLKARTTVYQVLMPTQMQPVQTGTIYVAPPGHHMKIANGLVYLTRDSKVRLARPSIDVLFESLAREYGEAAMAVLLCGMGEDGVAGTRSLAQQGAFVIVEDSDDCSAAKWLTDTAARQGQYSHILNIQEICSFIGSALAAGAARREPSQSAIQTFLEAINARYGYDYRGYQVSTVERRIKNIMALLRIDSFFELQRRVLVEPEVFRRFFQEMSIEVTGFFRHPEQIRLLREEIFPYLESFPNLRIWSAGCASGEEVFSLAIVLDELGMLSKARIFATDINTDALSQAQAGLFALDKLDENRANYRKSGGIRRFDDYVENNGLYLKVAERIRERVLFHQHSLVQDGVFNEFELIVCRNVMIYFKPELQKAVMSRFVKSLHPEGFLLLGPQEGTLASDSGEWFTEYKPHSRIYQWKH
jgi:chemotaxis protein methyltransferase CheR